MSGAKPVQQTIGGLINLIRPKQWVKNGFVLAPLLFSGLFSNCNATINAIAATLLFCIASSAIYIVNDLHDVQSDRAHPLKSKTRPLAAGIVSKSSALKLLAFLCLSLAMFWPTYPQVLLVISAYLALNLAYTFFLKSQPVIDIFTIAIGFVLRVFAGGVAIEVAVSSWMAITTLCLAVYLGAIKRRKELSLSGPNSRSVLGQYSAALVDRYAEMSATGALIFYSMYVLSEAPALVITIPLVLFGIFRYWFVVEALDGGESPTDVLISDRQLLVVVLLWISVCAWALRPIGG